MVPTLARMAVIIKSQHETNVITGNYEMAYICGFLIRQAQAVPPEPDSPGSMQEYTLGLMEQYEAKDEREAKLIRMLKAYKPERTDDEQVRELFRMGLEEKKPWQK